MSQAHFSLEDRKFFLGHWFKTGDVACRTQTGTFKILGRASMDIIKTGGFKVSALDIERELYDHPDIEEVAVVGVPDPEWGERVGAIVVQKNKAS
ncbi:acyl-CoA synthetase family member 3, mitochondrial [Batrachochytrium salamandrivorans]|nr:acyl-CoA synthetase family member 3, mitochondrial [Batrachochytrium salamandrivorans]